LVDSDEDYFIPITNVEAGVAGETAEQAGNPIDGLIDLFDVKGSSSLKCHRHTPRPGIRGCGDARRQRLWIELDFSVLVYA